MKTSNRHYAFSGRNLVAQGSLDQVALHLKSLSDQEDRGIFLLFDGISGRQLDIDLSGSVADVEQRYGLCTSGGEGSGPKKTRGRPKLGVVGREVTLLPRHWEWLDSQRGGASAALRRLIDQARKDHAVEDAVHQAQDSANRFMVAMAGDLTGFEEAVRALYTCDKARFEEETAAWPVDIRHCARNYAEAALI